MEFQPTKNILSSLQSIDQNPVDQKFLVPSLFSFHFEHGVGLGYRLNAWQFLRTFGGSRTYKKEKETKSNIWIIFISYVYGEFLQ